MGTIVNFPAEQATKDVDSRPDWYVASGKTDPGSPEGRMRILYNDLAKEAGRKSLISLDSMHFHMNNAAKLELQKLREYYAIFYTGLYCNAGIDGAGYLRCVEGVIEIDRTLKSIESQSWVPRDRV